MPKVVNYILLFLGIMLFFRMCTTSCNVRTSPKEFYKSPVDDMIRDMSEAATYSIILHDMDVEGTFSKDYKHKYKIIKQPTLDADPVTDTTGWFDVNEGFFNQHINHMGMELASKSEDGKVTKTASPPGYNNYIGNQRYGHWVNRNGSSFWEFYGQYAFMSSMFNMMSYPVRRSYYDDYYTNYYGRGRTYYGPSGPGGRSYYGTDGRIQSSRSNKTWYSKASNQSFKQRVNSSTSRSGSRFSGSSSSRSSGFGK